MAPRSPQYLPCPTAAVGRDEVALSLFFYAVLVSCMLCPVADMDMVLELKQSKQPLESIR